MASPIRAYRVGRWVTGSGYKKKTRRNCFCVMATSGSKKKIVACRRTLGQARKLRHDWRRFRSYGDESLAVVDLCRLRNYGAMAGIGKKRGSR